MKKLLITVNGKRYDVNVEVVADDEEGYHAQLRPGCFCAP
jgi:hypothetical protein